MAVSGGLDPGYCVPSLDSLTYDATSDAEPHLPQARTTPSKNPSCPTP